ncbi:PRC-barrel domain-containing protein [Piscinibacter sp. XHJ-5]|uniref:PRC-barrel domain-containing protein n=1 Tax=Piscinibacter sp. XHJ-5 TaxID=3037797 RepID=UPI00245282FE|nr:PRC-barrel domain-containing protein [Piscinibacter sp. XHJ-5]
MKRSVHATLLALASLLAAPHAFSQVAGTTTIGVEVTKLQFVASGWSAKKQILGKIVYNEDGDQVGRIDDLIIAPNIAVSFVIIGAGGFVGLKRHHVAIPAEQLSERDGNIVLPGATRAVIKALPAFEYAKPSRTRTEQLATPTGARS